MFDPFLPMRLAQATSEAMLRQVSASASMWTDVATRNMSLVGTLATSTMGLAPASRRTTRSWYRHPDAATPFSFPAVPASVNPFAPFLAGSTAWLGAFQPLAPPMPAAAATPWQPWLRLWSHTATLQPWPMAMMLMAAGMPYNAAWPAAEAGAHALAASAKAVEGMEQMFASYRSDGGHALAQIILPRRLH